MAKELGETHEKCGEGWPRAEFFSNQFAEMGRICGDVSFKFKSAESFPWNVCPHVLVSDSFQAFLTNLWRVSCLFESLGGSL